PGEVWKNVEQALRVGGRGLLGGDSIARLLGRCRTARDHRTARPLPVAQILRWADQHFAATGEWPNTRSGTVTSAPDEGWNRIDAALYVGNRGLPGGSSLAQLLQQRRRVRNAVRPPRLTAEQILKWADRHRKQTATWPSQGSGPVADAPGEFWHLLDAAL